MTIKAIALDMDGTLLDDHNSISEKLVGLIGALRKENIRIFIATGRTKKEIKDVLPENLHVDGFVTANGMSCFTNTKEISQHTLQANLVKNVLDNARERSLYYEVHPKDGNRFALKDDKEILEAEMNKPKPETLLNNELNSRLEAIQQEIEWVDKITYEGNLKVYFFSMSPEVINNWKNKLWELKQQTDLSLSSSSLHNVEIMVNNVSKATGIEMLLREYNLSHKNLMAIGDGENDLPMFDLAAYAVAMQNAENVVKEMADDITTYSYQENGLYEYLARWIQTFRSN